VIAHGGSSAAGYDPDDGHPLWRYEGLPLYCGNTPIMSREMIYLSCGSPDKLLVALPGAATGVITDNQVVWKSTRGVPYIPSPILLDGRLIVFAENGIVTAFDALTGSHISQRRIPDTFSASPVSINRTIVVPSESGTLFILDSSRGLEVSRQYSLEGEGFASAAASGANLYIRTTEFLYCFTMTSSL